MDRAVPPLNFDILPTLRLCMKVRWAQDKCPVVHAQKARNLTSSLFAFLYFLDAINSVDSLARGSDKSLPSALDENFIIF